MRYITSLVFALSLLMSVGCSTQPETTAATNPDDEVICRTDRELGSNFTRKTCKTVAEWRAEREETRELERKMQPGPVEGSDLPTAPGG